MASDVALRVAAADPTVAANARKSEPLAARPNYDLIAIDLDGTLLCNRGEVSKDNLRAIERAREAGVRVTVCTGRGMIECRHITDRIGQEEPVVVAGGAMLACPRSMRTLHRFEMDHTLVRELVDCMLSHGHAALVLKDPDQTGTSERQPDLQESDRRFDREVERNPPPSPSLGEGATRARGHDYLVVSPRGMEGIDPVTRWWFNALKVPVRVVETLEEDDHPEHSLRVGVCGTRRATAEVARDIRAKFAHRTTLHHFHAVVPGTNPATEDDHILILEAFDERVSKWTAIRWLAERDGLNPARIAAIGNDINDIAMLESAGLGIAVANAIDDAKRVSRRQTLSNEDHGVAHAIDRILAGEW